MGQERRGQPQRGDRPGLPPRSRAGEQGCQQRDQRHVPEVPQRRPLALREPPLGRGSRFPFQHLAARDQQPHERAGDGVQHQHGLMRQEG